MIPGSNHLGPFRDLLYDEMRETKLGDLERLFGVPEDDLPCWAIAVEPGDSSCSTTRRCTPTSTAARIAECSRSNSRKRCPIPEVIPTPGESGDTTATYRPHLDGLRAVAVYLVVLFHAGSGVFSGGYIGVDVFFVLSGYLVTQLLLRDLAGRGSIRFGRFYARRFRRLLPAAFVALIVTAVVFAAIASPAEVARRGRLVQGRVPLRHELVLHPPVDRVLRREHHREPGAALLVARGRGAVLPAVAAGARRPASWSRAASTARDSSR